MENLTILKSKDYELFDYFNFNREIKESHVKGLMKSIKEMGYDVAHPISIDDNFAIKDGQHRYEACKRLGEWVYYIISNVNIDTHNQIINLNTHQRSWSLGDFINAYAVEGRKCYVVLRDFEKTHRFGMTNSIAIVCNAHLSQSAAIRRGQLFEVNPKIQDVLDLVFFADDYLPFSRSNEFVRALVAVVSKLELESIDKFKQSIMLIKKQASTTDYLLNIQNLINKHVKREINRVHLI